MSPLHRVLRIHVCYNDNGSRSLDIPFAATKQKVKINHIKAVQPVFPAANHCRCLFVHVRNVDGDSGPQALGAGSSRISDVCKSDRQGVLVIVL